VLIANVTVICSLGHGLRTFTAVSGSTHSSTSFDWGKGGNDLCRVTGTLRDPPPYGM